MKFQVISKGRTSYNCLTNNHVLQRNGIDLLLVRSLTLVWACVRCFRLTWAALVPWQARCNCTGTSIITHCDANDVTGRWTSCTSSLLKFFADKSFKDDQPLVIILNRNSWWSFKIESNKYKQHFISVILEILLGYVTRFPSFVLIHLLSSICSTFCLSSNTSKFYIEWLIITVLLEMEINFPGLDLANRLYSPMTQFWWEVHRCIRNEKLYFLFRWKHTLFYSIM